jgi:diguanylate cyclase (GGDEF)-like protein
MGQPVDSDGEGSTRLREAQDRVREANAAAQAAYRDTARLIRLLGVLSEPSSPRELFDRTLAVLSDVFTAEIACVAWVVVGRAYMVRSLGLPEDAQSGMDGWELGSAAAQAMRTGRAVVDDRVDHLPQALGHLALTTAVYVPMLADPDQGDEMLVLLRSQHDPFSVTDLTILTSVAQRLAAVAAERERTVAIERLAQGGHVLATYHEPGPLVERVSELLMELTMSDAATVVSIHDGRTYMAAHAGSARFTPPRPGLPARILRAWPAAEQGRAFVTTASPEDARFESDDGPAQTPGTTICVPVMRDGAPVALLYAVRDKGRPYGPEVVEIATVFASYVASALENTRLVHELRRRATRDPLTGLANRDLAAQRLDEVLRISQDGPAGLLFCDLDGFKAVNDRLGHEAGDDLLLQVAERLRAGLRPHDLLARFGGDEFVVVLDEVHSIGDVQEVGRRLLRALQAPFYLAGERVVVSASVGGALGERGNSSASMMLRDADAAMYVAKARGPGGIEVFDEAASHRSLDRLSLRSELLHALEREEMEVLYQPVVVLRSRRLIGFEALLRWTHPHRGPIPPDVFIPLAEETGQIVPIGAFVLRQACRQLAAWHRRPGWQSLRLSVNLSAMQLWQQNAASQILDGIRAAGIDPHLLWLEVTERSYAGDDVAAVTRELRDGGVNFALDDFGTSYSNLNYLKQFPAESLKIDKSFVAGAAHEGTDRKIIRAILAMAESLGLWVVAEGIESSSQRKALMELGCQYGQGYLFAPGLTVSEAGDWLDASVPYRDVSALSRQVSGRLR